MDPRGVTHVWPPPAQQQFGRPRFSWMAVVALITAIAALVVGSAALATRPAAVREAAQPSSTPAAGDTTQADRALCAAVGPLLAEENRINNAYGDLGDSGTPSRDAATPQFITDILDWIGRVQPILDRYPDADPFLRRSVQRFIDDKHLIVLDLEPGPLPLSLRTLFSDSVGAFSGPLHVCERLGVRW